MTRPGLPTTNACAGTSRVTTAPAPTNAYSPIVVRQTTTTPAPKVAPRDTVVVSSSAPCFLMNARGEKSLVKITPGPRKTSSSIVTPSKLMTWFLTVTRSPMTAPPSTYAPSQMLQSRPTTAPGSMWANAHTLVPEPTDALSQSPLPCTNTPSGMRPPRPASSRCAVRSPKPDSTTHC